MLIAVGAVLGFVLTGGSSAATVKWSTVTGLQNHAPPWTNGTDTLADRLDAISLDPLGQEGQVLHIHAHLDVFWNGKKIQVPQGIGIEEGNYILALHTHNPSGVIHVESPTEKDFTLAQFMGAWGVRLTSACLANRCSDIRIYVDGKRYTQDPNDLVLKSHQEIAVVAGKAPEKIPSRYKFAPGE